VNRVVAQLIDTGYYAPPSLGIETDEVLSQVIARRLGVVGVAVVRVPRGSAGAKAGLRGVRQSPRGRVIPGDVITAINGKSVDSVARLLAVLDDYKPGTTVKVSIWRNGKTLDVKATLQLGDAEDGPGESATL
jgi:S1-C subfamily serine protease